MKSLSSVCVLLIFRCLAQGDDNPLSRRGYAEPIAIEDAIKIYNAQQRADSKLVDVKPLSVAELTDSIMKGALPRAVRENGKFLKRAKADLRRLQGGVKSGYLPIGTYLMYQVNGRSSGGYQSSFAMTEGRYAIYLLLNLNENPPEPYAYNYYAKIWAFPIRIAELPTKSD